MVSCELLAIIPIIASVVWHPVHLKTQKYLDTLLGIVANFQVEPENKLFLPLR